MSYIIRFEVRNVNTKIGKEVDKMTLDDVNKFYDDVRKLYGKDLVGFRIYEFMEMRV